MKKLLPVLLALVGLGVGIGAGVMLKPAPEPEEVAAVECAPDQPDCDPDAAAQAVPKTVPAQAKVDPEAVFDYVKMPKQFVIPIIKKDQVRALVVLSISLEVAEGGTDTVLAREPRIRDGFLQVMFDHANSGGFDGAFTTGQSMRDLRGSLQQVVDMQLGDLVKSVLIEEIVKQAM